MQVALAIVLLLLVGCATTIDEKSAAPDWPRLTVQRNVVSFTEVVRRCYRYMSLAMKLAGGIPLACAEVDFAQMRCDIWITADATHETLVHERHHCLGMEHPGETTLTDAWNSYKRSK